MKDTLLKHAKLQPLMSRIPGRVFFIYLTLFLFIPGLVFAREDLKQSASSLTLYEAVVLAIRNNRSVKNAYLDRIVQKFDLEVSESEFLPRINFDGSISFQKNRTKTLAENQEPATTTSTNSSSAGVTLTEKIPTGGDITLNWQHPTSATKILAADPMNLTPEAKSREDSLTFSFSQPLLKGGGIEVNMATLQRARISEERNILTLKSTLISTVNSVISSYRSLLQAERQLEISRSSQERSKALLEKNKLLIKVGKMAAMEIVQAEAEVARNNFAYQQALNNRDSAQLALIDILDIDRQRSITPQPEVEHSDIDPDQEKLLAVAYGNRVDYQQYLMTGRGLQIDMILAENNQLWDLSFIAGKTFNRTTNDNDAGSEAGSWNAGFNLKVPLYGDLSKKQAMLKAKTNLRKHSVNQLELKEAIAIKVQDAIRDVKMQQVQIKLSRQSRELSQKKLEIEQEKLHYGMTTNFQLVQFQNDLVAAQTSELNTKIAYLNALTKLDEVLGTTLKTWDIEIESSSRELAGQE